MGALEGHRDLRMGEWTSKEFHGFKAAMNRMELTSSIRFMQIDLLTRLLLWAMVWSNSEFFLTYTGNSCRTTPKKPCWDDILIFKNLPQQLEFNSDICTTPALTSGEQGLAQSKSWWLSQNRLEFSLRDKQPIYRFAGDAGYRRRISYERFKQN